MPFELPPLLASLCLPDDIPGLTPPQRAILAQEVRDVILRVVSQNGGHLAPSLGVVELTIALLAVFDPRRDAVVWDVGHQAYPWKLLTGRGRPLRHAAPPGRLGPAFRTGAKALATRSA